MKMLLLFMFMGLFIDKDCDQIFEQFIIANSQLEKPKRGQAYSLHLKITNEMSLPLNASKLVIQEMQTLIYSEGFYLKTDEVETIANGNKMITIIKNGKTIVQSSYDQKMLPDISAASQLQKKSIEKANSKTCQTITEQNKTYKKLSLYYKDGYMVNGYKASKIDYIIQSDNFRVHRVIIYFQNEQKIKSQTIDYIEFKTNLTTDRIPTVSYIYNSKGKIKPEFANYKIISK